MRAVISLYLPRANLDEIERGNMREIIGGVKERLARFCAENAGMCEGDSALVSDLVVVSGRTGEAIPNQATAHVADLVVVGSCGHDLPGEFGGPPRVA